MKRANPTHKFVLIIVPLLIFIALACGIGTGPGNQETEPDPPLADEILPPDDDSVEQPPEENVVEAVEEEILAFTEIADGFFLLSDALASQDQASLAAAYAKLKELLTEEEFASVEAHLRTYYSDIIFIGTDPEGDTFTCLADELDSNALGFVDTTLLFGGFLNNGDFGVSRISAFDVNTMGMSEIEYVLSNNYHQLMRLSFFNADNEEPVSLAQWQYEPNGEFQSVNVKPQDGFYITFDGVINGSDWLSVPTRQVGFFDNDIWTFPLDLSKFSGGTMFAFSSNSFDTENPDAPENPCFYDHSLLDDSGEPFLSIGQLQDARMKTLDELVRQLWPDGDVPDNINLELPGSMIKEDGFDLLSDADLEELRSYVEVITGIVLPPPELDEQEVEALADHMADGMDILYGFSMDLYDDELMCSGAPAFGSAPAIDIGAVAFGTTENDSRLMLNIILKNIDASDSVENFFIENGLELGVGVEIFNPDLEKGSGFFSSNQIVYSYIQDGSRFDLNAKFVDSEWDVNQIDADGEADGPSISMDEGKISIEIPGMFLATMSDLYVSSTNNGTGDGCSTDIVDPRTEILLEEISPREYHLGFRFNIK